VSSPEILPDWSGDFRIRFQTDGADHDVRMERWFVTEWVAEWAPAIGGVITPAEQMTDEELASALATAIGVYLKDLASRDAQLKIGPQPDEERIEVPARSVEAVRVRAPMEPLDDDDSDEDGDGSPDHGAG
jgi:hypothetical protein